MRYGGAVFLLCMAQKVHRGLEVVGCAAPAEDAQSSLLPTLLTARRSLGSIRTFI